MAKPEGVELRGVVIVDEVAVVEGNADAVQVKAGEEGGVGVSEKVFEEFVKEELRLFWAEDGGEGCSMFVFVA